MDTVTEKYLHGCWGTILGIISSHKTVSSHHSRSIPCHVGTLKVLTYLIQYNCLMVVPSIPMFRIHTPPRHVRLWCLARPVAPALDLGNYLLSYIYYMHHTSTHPSRGYI